MTPFRWLLPILLVSFIHFSLSLGAFELSSLGSKKYCRLPTTDFPNGERVKSPRSHERLSTSQLPQKFFWGDVDGINYLTEIKNQHIPQYCGSCWAMATTSSLSDRIKIKKSAKYGEVVLSPQVLVNCNGGGTCNGGDPYEAYEFIYNYGIPDETCQNYAASNRECAPYGVCEDCHAGSTDETFLPGTCSPVSNFTIYKVNEFGHVHRGLNIDKEGNFVSKADKIKAEILLRGPVSCGMYVTDNFVLYSGGIYSEFSLISIPNHEVSLVGWGYDNQTNTPFWIGRNSWGTYWGEKGLFRIRMHYKNLGIENSCTWGDPDEYGSSSSPAYALSASKFHSNKNEKQELYLSRNSMFIRQVINKPEGSRLENEENLVEIVKNKSEIVSPFLGFEKYMRGCGSKPCLRRSKIPVKPLIKSPLPHTYLTADDIPESYDIRNLNGKNYATINKNQHIPQYCGSCWTFGSASSLSDRIKLLRDAAFPDINLAPQVLVNCVKDLDSNGCHGGDPAAVYAWMVDNGLPDETCANYEAIDKMCSEINTCSNCDHQNGCWAVSDYPKYYVEEHGTISGEEQMLAEISARGPITCDMCVTNEFALYTGGIFNDTTGCVETDHCISIAGFGVSEDGVKYWIGRNSWGTYWGEEGWFKIIRGTNNLAIESNCNWAVPKVTW